MRAAPSKTREKGIGFAAHLRDKDGIACALEHFERAGAAPIATACLRQKSREPRVGWQPHALLEVILRLLRTERARLVIRVWQHSPVSLASESWMGTAAPCVRALARERPLICTMEQPSHATDRVIDLHTSLSSCNRTRAMAKAEHSLACPRCA
eukprot:2334442-Pleurochrysis_carterae.AAC.2